MTALIEFRGQDLLADGLRLQLTAGYSDPLTVRGKDTVIPQRPGRIAHNRVADTRILRLEGHVKASSPAEWRIATDLLMAIADTTLDPGDLILRAPYLGLATGVTATIAARCTSALPGPIMSKLFQRWSLELISVDPDWVLTGP